MVICLQRGADLHMAQMLPLPLTFSCFSKTEIGLAFVIPAHLGSPGKRAVKCVRVYPLGPQQQNPHMLLQRANGTDRWTDTVLLPGLCSAY